ncbi:MAG: D-alanine--D-alanine ligase [Cyclobacteriaceae bacterium]|nr:D-alanine--D-alanine ligase [Cyclobacteriaceae bacterium]
MSKKLSIAILYGGRSVEHEISIRSAKNVLENIDKESFSIILLGINKNGSWYLNKTIDDEINSGVSVSINLDASAPHLIENKSGSVIKIDVVFPVLHGTDGEDGSIQGLFKSLNLPVVGSSVLGSAISMDKIISKKILKECGIPVAAYLEFDRLQKDIIKFDEIVDNVGLPFMIKSAALGSSVGISMIKSEKDFPGALEDSFKYGDKVIIEQFVKGRELECAVMGNEQPKATVPGEILMIKDYDFYTYTAKYLDEEAIEIRLPAEVDESMTEEIKRVSILAYQALRCEDYARVDLFISEEGEIIINEINTIPGFTNASMFPMMWKEMGISFNELISELISLCLKRYYGSKDLETEYNGVN